MKIEQKQPEFQPITITLETQDELDQLVAMAFHCNFDEAVGGEDSSSVIYRSLGDRILTKYKAPGADPIYLEIVK